MWTSRSWLNVLRHSLSDKDVNNETAWCSVCGPTRIRQLPIKPSGYVGWQCYTAYLEGCRRATARNQKGKHGLTLEESREYIEKHGPCHICGRSKDLNVDHDHATGKIRGVLCNTCNMGLGCLGDNMDGLRKAAHYLKGIK